MRGNIQATIPADINGNALVTQGTAIAGEDLTNNVLNTEVKTSYSNTTTSAAIKSGAGRFFGWMVNSCAAGSTIKFWDNTTATIPILLNTITYTATVNQGPSNSVLPVAVNFATGLYASVTGTIDYTVFYQ